MNAILSAVETGAASFWSPSRGPTSTTMMGFEGVEEFEGVEGFEGFEGFEGGMC
jgi:hypothetical protein